MSEDASALAVQPQPLPTHTLPLTRPHPLPHNPSCNCACNLSCKLSCKQVEVELSEPEPGNTVLQLKHTGLPEADKFGHGDVQEQVEQGWRGQIFNRIRAVFGYGV